ncbi:MAG TPA: DUF2142 domain-containing protein [Mycobacteriales bacterium]|nr:DUF2142 domain-containing protein [Mycobacteriales bacterium]
MVLPLVLLWSIATPLGAAPDEPEHVVTAAYLDRGHLLPPVQDTPAGRGAVVTVPGWLQDATGLPSCYAFHPEQDASCSPHLTSETTPKLALTQFSRYPQTYYAIVGLPTRALTGPAAYWAVRILSALLCGALLALGLELLVGWHPRRRAAIVGASVAVTPMALFLAGSVTTSGVEVAAAFATTAGLVCLADREGPPPRAVTARTTLAATVLVLSRPLSPVFLLVLLLATLALCGRHRLATTARAAPRSMLALPAAAIAISGAWIAVAGLPAFLGSPSGHHTASGELGITLGRTGRMLAEQVGRFGWVDTPAPLLTIAAWTIGVVALLVVGIARRSSGREVVAWCLPAAAALLQPVVLEAPRINTLGTFFQGRYCLPMSAAAVVILATRPGVGAAIDRVAPMVLRTVAVLWFVGQTGAFLAAWHRYALGAGRRAFTLHPAWQPPGGFLTVILFVVCTALVAAVIGRDRPGAARRNLEVAMRGSPGARSVPRYARGPSGVPRPVRGVAAADDHVRRRVSGALPPPPHAESDR